MFTNKTIDLRLFDNDTDLSVERNCRFSYVGKVPSNLQDRVVPCSQRSHLTEALNSEGIVGIITSRELAPEVPNDLGLAVSADPMHSALDLQTKVARIDDFQWNSFESVVHERAIVYPGAYVAPRDVIIGEGTVVYPNAVVLERTIIGNYCSIGPGTVVSTNAFEVDTKTQPYCIPAQSGGVLIEDHVDIQAKCTIVRATFGGFTRLGAGTKLDCQVHFAHDCVTGNNVRIAACAEISGRVSIGDRVFVGPNASLSNGITVGEDAKITIGAVVTRDVPAGETVTGNFAVSHKKWISFMRSLK